MIRRLAWYAVPLSIGFASGAVGVREGWPLWVTSPVACCVSLPAYLCYLRWQEKRRVRP